MNELQPPTALTRSRRIGSTLGGYALIAALLMVLAASLAAMLAVHRAQTEAQREREAQLLFVGNQYRQALRSYYSQRPVGSVPQYPSTLEELLADTRFAQPVRHLRRLFVDPMTGRADWVLDRSQGRIVGLHSRSDQAPLRHANFSSDDSGFAKAETYAQWAFSAGAEAGLAAAVPPVAVGATGGSASPPSAVPAAPGAPAASPGHSVFEACAGRFLTPAATSACDALKPTNPAAVRACYYSLQRQYADCIAGAPGG